MTSEYITDELISKAKGAQYPTVSFDDFETLKIPIPSFERQKEIVDYCEFNDTLIKQLEKEIENNKKQAEKCITSILKTQGIEEQAETISLNTEPNINVEREALHIETDFVIEPKQKTKMIVNINENEPIIIKKQD